MAHALPTWHEPEAVLSLATLGVAEREGVGRTDIIERLAGLAGADRSASSTCPASTSPLLRSAAAWPAGQPIRYLVPDAVAAYIDAAKAVPMSAPSRRPAAPLEPAKLAELIAGYASDVKAQDIVELDLRGVLGYTDYFVVATGGTDRQAKAIHDRIHENMKKEHGLLPRRVEGLSRGALDPHGLPGRDRPHLHARTRASTTGSSSSGAKPPSASSSSRGRAPETRKGRPSGGPFT